MRVKVKYYQIFMGEVLKDEYESWIDTYEEISGIERALYDDPHVFSVSVEVVEGNEYN